MLFREKMDNISNKYVSLCLCLALAAATLVIYWPVRNYDFINYDDVDYVTENEYVKAGLTSDSIIWALKTGYVGNWHPLTWLSHVLDCHIFGTNAGRHHLTNLLLHIANTLLLFGLFKRMTGAVWRSAFVAAVFALHPLHVESVAWVSERKDVLSTLFWFLTMAAYLRYVERPSVSRYLLTLLAFALGLMAKPMLVSLPIVLLLMDYWPLCRLWGERAVKGPDKHREKSAKKSFQSWKWRGLVWEKVPFFVLAAASSVVTFIVQQRYGTVVHPTVVSLNVRIANALVSYLKYIVMMFWPGNLAVLYPHLINMLPKWQIIVAVLFLLGVSVWVIYCRKTYKYFLFGWLWYLVTLVPVIGLVQVGRQALADRYTYIPLTGLFVIIAWGVPDLLSKFRFRKIVLVTAAGLTLVPLSICTRLQLRYWRDGLSLFEHAFKITENNYVMGTNYAEELLRDKRYDEAIAMFNKVLRINPKYYAAHHDLGAALQMQGKFEEALTHYQKALQLRPDNAKTYNNVGVIYHLQGKLTESVRCQRRALQFNPRYYEAHNDLGATLQLQGKIEEAISHYRMSLEIKPDYVTANNNLGRALMKQGKLDEAAVCFIEVLRTKPNYPDAHSDLGSVFLQQGKFDSAVAHLKKALRLKPNWVKPMNNLAWILATQKDSVHYNPDEAIALSERACELTEYQDPNMLDTLALAYSEDGRLNEALAMLEKALALAESSQNEKLAEQIQNHLTILQQRQPDSEKP